MYNFLEDERSIDKYNHKKMRKSKKLFFVLEQAYENACEGSSENILILKTLSISLK